MNAPHSTTGQRQIGRGCEPPTPDLRRRTGREGLGSEPRGRHPQADCPCRTTMQGPPRSRESKREPPARPENPNDGGALAGETTYEVAPPPPPQNQKAKRGEAAQEAARSNDALLPAGQKFVELRLQGRNPLQ